MKLSRPTWSSIARPLMAWRFMAASVASRSFHVRRCVPPQRRSFLFLADMSPHPTHTAHPHTHTHTLSPSSTHQPTSQSTNRPTNRAQQRCFVEWYWHEMRYISLRMKAQSSSNLHTRQPFKKKRSLVPFLRNGHTPLVMNWIPMCFNLFASSSTSRSLR